MRQRIELQKLLQSCAGTGKVYFQPPESVRMTYPCIIYTLDRDKPKFADNKIFHNLNRYTVTVVDKDPEGIIKDRVRELKYCSFERSFRADNLNHFVFTIYF